MVQEINAAQGHPTNLNCRWWSAANPGAKDFKSSLFVSLKQPRMNPN